MCHRLPDGLKNSKWSVNLGLGADIFQGKSGGGASDVNLGIDQPGSADFVRLYCHKDDKVTNIDKADGDNVRGYEAKDCPNKLIKRISPIRRF